jgi:hypothetical protein
MRRTLVAAVLGLGLSLAAHPAFAQDWSPPSRQMPQMPSAGQMSGGWKQSLASWFGGVEAVSGVPLSGVRASGDARQVRFSGGVRPVAVWTDRNGDGRCDMLEVYRSGAVAYQLIDADFDGQANVLRVYDPSGALARESRM